MEQKEERGGALRVGMVWGGIGGLLGFFASLLGSLAGIIAGIFVGYSCGRRAAGAETDRPGALSGLIGGAVAAPVYVVGASAGALVAARGIGSPRMAATLSEVLGTSISPDEAWTLFLLSIVLSAVIQAALFVAAATVAGALAKRS
ncbi:hypothetical protein GBA63_14535 [Rubrobacter tropicus]|uniref:Uncharacterized protein n=1 Tax=Rubrobacter tropicus TaxID=2653851 RepID=A0A6G8QBA7_9ACTN|nr:hypothetical protein [Rubrobacter tropicus]QIN83712.1 hypothetical protein GBA63_14535 [Rubrobacter tropicus]